MISNSINEQKDKVLFFKHWITRKLCCRVNARALNNDTKLSCPLYSSDLFTTIKLSVTQNNCFLNIHTALTTESCPRSPRHKVTNSNATPPWWDACSLQLTFSNLSVSLEICCYLFRDIPQGYDKWFLMNTTQQHWPSLNLGTFDPLRLKRTN